MATDVWLELPASSGGGGSGVTSLNGLTGDLSIASTTLTITPSGSIININATGVPDNMARFDGSGNLSGIPGAFADDNGLIVLSTDGGLPSTTINQLVVNASVGTSLSGGYEGIIVGPDLNSTMAFMSSYNSEVNFDNGYSNSGGTTAYQDQSVIAASASFGSYTSFNAVATNNGAGGSFRGFSFAAQNKGSLSGDMTAYSDFSTMTAGSSADSYQGAQFSPTFNSGSSVTEFVGFDSSPNLHSGSSIQDFTGLQITPNLQGIVTGNFNGIEISPNNNATFVNATGVNINMNNIRSSDPQGPIGLSSNARIDINAVVALADGLTFEIGNRVETLLTVASGSPITGTDALANNLAGDLEAQDNIVIGPAGLGINSVGFIADLAVATGKTVDKFTVFLPGLALPDPGFPTGGTITDCTYVNIIPPFSQGGTLVTTNLYAFRVNTGFSGVTSPTNAWGLFIDDTGVDNHLASSLAVATVSNKVSNASVGIELGDATKAVRFSNMTATQKNALTALPGMQVFDTTLNQMSYYNGTSWINF